MYYLSKAADRVLAIQYEPTLMSVYIKIYNYLTFNIYSYSVYIYIYRKIFERTYLEMLALFIPAGGI